jgi:hypothetical protein
MDIESKKMGSYPSIKWNCLNILHIIVNEADDPENENIYYANYNGRREIIICDIPSLMKYGTDFDRSGVQAKLSGLAERYKDDDGDYIVSVLTTHDLNSAVIKDTSELMFQMAMN